MASVAVLGRPFREEGLVSGTSGSESEEYLLDPKARSVRAAWRARWTGRRNKSEETKVTPPRLNYIERDNWRDTQFDISPSALPFEISPSALSAPARSSALHSHKESSSLRRQSNKKKRSRSNFHQQEQLLLEKRQHRPRQEKEGKHDIVKLSPPRGQSRRRRLGYHTEDIYSLSPDLYADDERETMTPTLFNQYYNDSQQYDPICFLPDHTDDVNIKHSNTWPALSSRDFSSPLQSYQLQYHQSESMHSGSQPRRRLTHWLGACCGSNKHQRYNTDERCY